MLAEKDEYINEAFKHLEMISQDREKQIAYTSRLKALMDYNTIMEERYEDGRQEGIQQGEQQGIQKVLNRLTESGIKIPDELLNDLK